VLTAGPVSAHSALQSSTPADQAELVQPPTAVTLTFNEAVDSEFSDVVVTGPDGQARQEGATQVQGSTVTQPLRPLTEDGRYDVAYRVVSADGHPITGELSFTVTLPPLQRRPPRRRQPARLLRRPPAAALRPNRRPAQPRSRWLRPRPRTTPAARRCRCWLA